MTDQSLTTLSEAEYAALDATLSASARGRLFLAEVRSRGRNRDLTLVLAAVEKLGRREAPVRDVPPNDTPKDDTSKDDGHCMLQAGLADLAGAIARAGVQISALEGDGAPNRPLGQRLHEQHRALTEVLDAAERIQEAAWTLREQGVDGPVCDFLDERATEIYAACGRQETETRVAAAALAAYDFIVERVGDLCRTGGIASTAPGSNVPAAASRAESFRPSLAALPTSTALVSGDVAFVLPEDRVPAAEPLPVEDGPDPFAELDRLSTREKLALFS